MTVKGSPLTRCGRVPLLLWIVLLASCQSPFLVFPGGTLSGEVVYVDSFAFAKDFKLLKLELSVTPAYSVNLRTTVIDGRLFVDAAPARRWAKLLAETSMVRIKLGGKVYPATAIVETNPEITRQFLSGRTIYEIVPSGS